MKKDIIITTTAVKLVHETKSVDLPQENKYYRKGEIGDFGLQCELFAILPKYRLDSEKYILVNVKRDEQLHTDFHPENDCKSEYWLKDGDNNLRRKALQIMTDQNWLHDFKEITPAEFATDRAKLLNFWQESVVKN